MQNLIIDMDKKFASYEIWTRAGFPPADLESAALDRSAKDASYGFLANII